jgi:hypothetical protein
MVVPSHQEVRTVDPVTGIRQITACQACQTSWDDGSRPACVDATHAKTHHTLHVHEDDVVLPDGTTIVAVSHTASYTRGRTPDFGLFLDGRWSPPWPHDHVAWPDFGLPDDVGRFREQLSGLLSRAREGARVELGCLGGHGRTGTALACAAILSGYDASTAVAWVRAVYCDRAVETAEQERFVQDFAAGEVSVPVAVNLSRPPRP